MSRLRVALEKRSGTPQRAMRALGLDMSLLRDEAQGTGQPQEERLHDAPLTTLRTALDKIVKKHGRDSDPLVKELREIADRHDRTAGDRHRRRRAKDGLAEMQEHEPEQNLSGGEDDDPPVIHPASRQNENTGRVTYDDFEDFLADHGFSEDEISEVRWSMRATMFVAVVPMVTISTAALAVTCYHAMRRAVLMPNAVAASVVICLAAVTKPVTR